MWRRVLKWYIVCIVIKDSDVIPKRIQTTYFADISTHYNLLHHRLDILPPSSLCRHLNQISTLGKFHCSIFVSRHVCKMVV